jgi:spore germination protein GerM
MMRLIKLLLLAGFIFLIVYGGLIVARKSAELETGTKIYFYYHGNLRPVLRDFSEFSPQEQLSKTIAALWAGPTEKEQRQGVVTLIPKDVEIVALTRQGDILTIKLNKYFLNLSGNAQIEGVLKQIVFTLTQFADIRAVNFEVEGVTGTLIIGGEGYTISAPLTREFFK